jgi:hypothetical protein
MPGGGSGNWWKGTGMIKKSVWREPLLVNGDHYTKACQNGVFGQRNRLPKNAPDWSGFWAKPSVGDYHPRLAAQDRYPSRCFLQSCRYSGLVQKAEIGGNGENGQGTSTAQRIRQQ